MSCIGPSANGLTICTPPQGIMRRLVQQCPVCDRRRRMVAIYGGAWYGDMVICLGCGDAWSEGWRMERPFLRGWRAASKAKARAAWANALTPTQWRTAISADLERALP